MEFRKIYSANAIQLIASTNGRAVRKNLNADALIKAIQADFREVTDHRADNTRISAIPDMAIGSDNLGVTSLLSVHAGHSPRFDCNSSACLGG